MSKYDATIKIGNATVRVIAPKNMTQAECQAVLDENNRINGEIWRGLPHDKQTALNTETEKENQRYVSRCRMLAGGTSVKKLRHRITNPLTDQLVRGLVILCKSAKLFGCGVRG